MERPLLCPPPEGGRPTGGVSRRPRRGCATKRGPLEGPRENALILPRTASVNRVGYFGLFSTVVEPVVAGAPRAAAEASSGEAFT